MDLLQTSVLAAQTIVNPLLAATYTATARMELLINVGLSDVVGNNVYRSCVTRQRSGAGTEYQSPTSAAVLALTVTTLWLPSLSIAVNSGDVLKVYVQGVAGDVAVGVVTEIFDVTAMASADACEMWGCSSRTLTMSLASIKSMLLGSKLELWRGDTLAQTITGLGDLSLVDDLWFTVKKQDLNDLDATSEIQISLTGGLLAIAGATATTPANGSITINLPATQGSITVNLAAVEMAKLAIDFTGYWDIQKLTGAVVQTITRGNASVLGDVTRRII